MAHSPWTKSLGIAIRVAVPALLFAQALGCVNTTQGDLGAVTSFAAAANPDAIPGYEVQRKQRAWTYYYYAVTFRSLADKKRIIKATSMKVFDDQGCTVLCRIEEVNGNGARLLNWLKREKAKTKQGVVIGGVLSVNGASADDILTANPCPVIPIVGALPPPPPLPVIPPRVPPVSVLVYGHGSGSTRLATEAANLGYTVTVYDATQWSAATTATFQTFQVIAIPSLSGGDTTSLFARRTQLGNALSGNAVVSGLHADGHLNNAGASQFIDRALSYASSGAGTGFFTQTDQNSPSYVWMPAKGNLVNIATTGGPTATEPITITIPGHASMVGLSSAGLSGWGQSAHNYFSNAGGLTVVATGAGDVPPGSFEVLAGPI